MNKKRQATGIMVHVLNIEAVMAKKGLDLRPPQELGMVKTANGTYLLDTEGTGPDNVLEVEPAEIWLSPPNERTEGGWEIIATPTHSIRLTADMAGLCPVKRVVDLADFIRVFGRRLEENFEVWRTVLQDGKL